MIERQISQTDGGKSDARSWAQEHVMSAYVEATSSFGLKFLIEIIGRNRVEITVTSP